MTINLQNLVIKHKRFGLFLYELFNEYLNDFKSFKTQ